MKKKKNKKAKYGLAFQIKEAQRQLARWPKWMKDNAYFAGSDLKDNR